MGTNCDDCGLGLEGRKNDLENRIAGNGSIETGIMFVGDVAGKYDCIIDEPFSGSVGMLLAECLEKGGYKRRDVYVTNLIKCAITKSKRAPKKDELEACEVYLKEEIKKIKPKVIVPLGVFDMDWEYEDEPEQNFSCKVIPTYAPKSLISRPMNLYEMQSDINRSFDVLEDGYEPIDTDYEYTDDYEKVYNMIKDKDIYAWDIETTGLDEFRDDIITCSFSWEEGQAICIPFNQEWFEKIFALGIRNVTHTKFDPKFLLCRYGIKVENWYFDTFAAVSILNDNIGQGLKSLASLYTDVRYYNLDSKVGLAREDIKVVAEYNNVDTDVTFRLYKKFYKMLGNNIKFHNLFFDTTMPVNRMLIEIEAEGIDVDIDKLKKITLERNLKILEINQELNDVAPINWNSVAQVREVLFGKIGLKSTRKTPTGAKSTDVKALTELAEKHRVPRLILDLRHQMKGVGTYLLGVEEFDHIIPKGLAKEKHEKYKLIKSEIAILDYLNDLDSYHPEIKSGLFQNLQDDNRIHNQNRINGTVSGRLTSPLHTIPRDGGYRDCYVAPPLFKFVGMDFKQFELNIAAYEADETKLIEILKSPDVKQLLTKLIINLDYDEKTWSGVKGVIYGTLYGRGARSIAQEYNIDEDFAQELLNNFYKQFPKLKRLLKGYKKEALDNGFIEDMVGRRRRFYTKKYKIFDDDADIVRQAVNFPIQSGSSAIFWPQVLKVHEHLREHQSKLIHTKHDAIYLKVHKEEMFLIDEVKDLLEKDTLIGDTQVDVKIGEHWGEC
jgi:DNA polymerase-1